MSQFMASVTDGPVTLRPIRYRDASAWRRVRMDNRDWLNQWDATSPMGTADVPPTFAAMVRILRHDARAGRTIPWVILYQGRLVGQLTFGGISMGSLRSAHAGYWVAQTVAGLGIAPTAVAMGIDHCFALGMHRVEINIRPENYASRRVVEKLGLRYEGLRERYLHIDGQWCDHLSYAVISEEVSAGVLARWRSGQVQS